ncbi:MAG: YaiI/YqxD family protein [Gammaproteobacteria bacterium]|nr:YaiI/YqxD family protein [Gammaproteobacteria bacterium]
MQLLVDADACPNVIKEILYRAAQRLKFPLVLVANQSLRLPPSPYIRSIRVPGGFDAADSRILEEVEAGDLVITADIPLAAGVVEKGAFALNPRGELYTVDNIRERLAIRDLMSDLRDTGINTGGPGAISKSERQAFANRLDQMLARTNKRPGN